MMNQSPADIALSRAMIRWSLSQTEPVDETASNWLYRAEQNGRRSAAVSILKPEASDVARRSLAMLQWYGGEGAVAVYDIAGDTALMEWVDGTPLSEPAMEGRAHDAAIAFAQVVAGLHQRRSEDPPPGLAPLYEHVAPVLAAPVSSWPASARDLLIRAQSVGRLLFEHPEAQLPLHGNLTYDTIVSSERGWLATAPLGLFGEATWDAATALLGSAGTPEFSAEPERIAALIDILSPRLSLPPRRLLDFAIVAAALKTGDALAHDGRTGPYFSLLTNLLAARAKQ